MSAPSQKSVQASKTTSAVPWDNICSVPEGSEYKGQTISAQATPAAHSDLPSWTGANEPGLAVVSLCRTPLGLSCRL